MSWFGRCLSRRVKLWYLAFDPHSYWGCARFKSTLRSVRLGRAGRVNCNRLKKWTQWARKKKPIRCLTVGPIREKSHQSCAVLHLAIQFNAYNIFP